MQYDTLIEHDGRTQTLSDWALELGYSAWALRERLMKRWSMAEIIKVGVSKPRKASGVAGDYYADRRAPRKPSRRPNYGLERIVAKPLELPPDDQLIRWG